MNEPKRRWLLVALVALATVVVVFLIAWAGGFILVRPRHSAPASAATNDPNDQRIKGNFRTMIYHKPGCLNYASISEENIEWFKTEKEAQDAGYRAVKNCS